MSTPRLATQVSRVCARGAEVPSPCSRQAPTVTAFRLADVSRQISLGATGLLVLLAACSPGGEGGGQASGSPSASESSPAGEAGAQVTGDPAGSGGGAPAGTWDPLSWEPSVRV